MTTTRTITLYKYEELSESAKEKAREIFYDINDRDSCDNDTCEFWQTEKLPELGFEDAEVFYSGFWSQGDGASFKCNVNILTWLKVNKLCNQYRALYYLLTHEAYSIYVNFLISKTSMYNHENTMYIENEELQTEDDEKYSKAIEQFESLKTSILSNARKIAKQIYKDLEENYNYDHSREAIEETIIINEYDFDVEGNRPAKIY